MKKIVAIVVTYNRVKLLKECIEALITQTYKQFDIIIIDNNSTDNTHEVVRGYMELNSNIKYINTGENLGGAGGFNFGLKEVFSSEYDYCWIMDDDTVPNKEALKAFVEKIDILNNDFSYMSSLTKWKDNTICKMNSQKISDNWLDEADKINNHLLNIEYATFVSCFINLSVAKKIGLPIKEFFIYWDDIEYTLRLSNEKKAYLVSDSVVIHKMKNNEKVNVITFSCDRLDRLYFKYRNMFFTVRKRMKIINVIKGIVHCFVDFFLILFKARDKKLKRIYYMLKGMIVGLLFFNPKIEEI